MAINPLIALGTQAPDVGRAINNGLQTADNISRLREFKETRGDRDKARTQQIELSDIALDKARNSERERSIAVGALEAMNYADDPLRLLSHLEGRVSTLQSEGKDPGDTMEAVEALRAGDHEGAVGMLQGAVKMGHDLGYLSTGKDGRTSLQKNFEAAGLPFDGPEFKAAVLDSGKSGTNVSIVQEAEAKGLTEEQKALGKSRVKRFEGLQEASDNAIDQNEQLAQLEGVDFQTGFGQETKTQLANALNFVFGDGFGADLLDANIVGMQAYRAISKRMQATELNKAKGPQTEGDAKRIADTLANVTNEAEANRFLIQSTRATNDRKIEQARFYEQILDRDGSLKKADREWAKYKRETPMVSDSVTDPKTGLPMFFNEFIRQGKRHNPGASQEQLINAWRELQ